MAAHDRIRLTGRLRKAPAQAGAFYFLSRAPEDWGSGGETLRYKLKVTRVR